MSELFSSNGWLMPVIAGPPRITARQKQMSLRSFEAVLKHAVDRIKCEGEKAFVAQNLKTFKEMFSDAFEEYPNDRSCHSCDYFVAGSGHCLQWEQKVPGDALDAGCKRWQDDGMPF